METIKNKTAKSIPQKSSLLHLLDKGIDDMEAGRELLLEDAFKRINELRNSIPND